jgi:uncharacterized protein (TIGR00661 family)
MKILYAIQGTGNGHVSRAREIIPILKKYGQVDILISGTQADVNLDDEIKYRFKGFGFDFGTNGGINYKSSFKKADFRQLIRDVRNLPVKDYDLVINDFEPVTAWACILRNKKSIALSHQSAFLSVKTPVISGFHLGEFILKTYAPASKKVSFHFKRYDDFIRTPVIRSEIRALKSQNLGHYTVYLPAYSDEFILKKLEKFPNKKFQVFSKHTKEDYTKGNIEVSKVNNLKFNQSLADCEGLLTGGGFEGPAEAMFLGKKVLCVPMFHQYEQQCNALAAEDLGATVIWNEKEFDQKLKFWIEEGESIKVDFPDETEEVILNIINSYQRKF